MTTILRSGPIGRFPRTRYQGSKRRYAAAIVEQLGGLTFESVLDAFGGTGAVAYAFKQAGKQVTYNDVLAFNHQIGLALIENDSATLSDAQVAALGSRRAGVQYGDFIERTFDGIYFTREENRWLDTAVGNVRRIRGPYQRALAWYALFQSAIAKRPYNLFHRSNLSMRTSEVPRSFGNKASWDRPWSDHIRTFAREANNAVFKGRRPCRALCGDVLDLTAPFDLVYIDTPYINRTGVGVDYRAFYHFLEGMVDYDAWPDRIDPRARHLPLRRAPGRWSSAATCRSAFRDLFSRFRESILVVSYRADGIPTIAELTTMLRDHKRRVRVVRLEGRPYALSKVHRANEMLLVAHS